MGDGLGHELGDPPRPSCTSESLGDLSRSHALSHPCADKEGLADPEGCFRGPWVPMSPDLSTRHWEAEGSLPGRASAGGLQDKQGFTSGGHTGPPRRGVRGPQAQETAGGRVGGARFRDVWACSSQPTTLRP